MQLASTSDTSWMDNVFYGWIDTTWDALLVLEAARRGIVPRVTRRFHDIEKRNMIRSGAVIVFTEEESSVKRWTDPYLWSASRMLGNFMIYREREDARDTKVAPATLRSTLQKPKERCEGLDPELERAIYGSWRRGKGLKKDGLMKKTFSLVVDGATYHLISYYNPNDVVSGTLRTPSSMPHVANLPIGPEFTADHSQFRLPPTDLKRPETISSPILGSHYNPPLSSNYHHRPSSSSSTHRPGYQTSSPTPPHSPTRWSAPYAAHSEDSRYSNTAPSLRLHDMEPYGHTPSPAPYHQDSYSRHYGQNYASHRPSAHSRRGDDPPHLWQIDSSPTTPTLTSPTSYSLQSDHGLYAPPAMSYPSPSHSHAKDANWPS